MTIIPRPDQRLFTQLPMLTVYARPGTRIDLAEDSNFLMIVDPEVKYRDAIHSLRSLHTVSSFGRVTITPEAQEALLKHKVAITYFEASGGYLGRLEPAYSARGDVIRAQALITEQQRLHMTQRIIWGGLRTHRRFLQRTARERHDSLSYAEGIKALEESIKAVEKKSSLIALSSLVGGGLSFYYKALSNAVVGWEYGKRNQSLEDTTPLTAMLTFIHRVLEESVKTALIINGLNPNSAIWHTTDLSKELGFEFKPYAEAVVIRAINRRQIALKDFDNEEWGYYRRIPQKVIAVLLEEYEKKMRDTFTYPFTTFRCSYEQAIEIQARQLALYLVGDVSEYAPLNVK